MSTSLHTVAMLLSHCAPQGVAVVGLALGVAGLGLLNVPEDVLLSWLGARKHSARVRYALLS